MNRNRAEELAAIEAAISAGKLRRIEETPADQIDRILAQLKSDLIRNRDPAPRGRKWRKKKAKRGAEQQ